VRLVLAAILALGCSRPKSDDAHRAPKADDTALPAPEASAPTESEASASAAPTLGPPAPGEAPNGSPTTDATNGAVASVPLTPLQATSAERLLAEVRRLGGKGTLVNAWASWCGPCKHEIPMLEKLAAKLEPRGVHVRLVSLDEPDDREKAAAFLRERKIALTSYLAERPLGAFKQGMNPRWPGMLPASFLYDASGTLRYFWGGEAFEDELWPVLDAFAAGKPIEGESTPAVAPEGESH
jgi:thiol-disulfide isomerase/thioredoxin